MKQLGTTLRMMRTNVSQRCLMSRGKSHLRSKGSRLLSYGTCALSPSFIDHNFICFSREIQLIKSTWKWSLDA